jgi:hypothetical protein
MKMAIFTAIIVFMSMGTAFAQELDWQKANNWKIYSINQFAVFNYPPDTLKNFRSVDLNDDTIKSFLIKVRKLSKEESPVWMGLYFLTCQILNEPVRKVEVSVYGGFFYDEFTKTYYELPEEIRGSWLDYLSINYKKTVTAEKLL